MWAVVGRLDGSALLLLSVLPAVYSLGMKVSDQIRAGAAPAGGAGAACSLCTRVTGTSQTLSFPLIGCVEAGEMDSCKSNYSHWVEPQTVDFYTADLCLIMLSDHNLAKKKKKKKCYRRQL